MALLIILIAVGVFAAWIYAEAKLGRGARILLGLTSFVIILACYHIAAAVAASYREVYYRSAIRMLIPISQQASKEELEAVLTRYQEAGKNDGIHSFRGAVVLSQEMRKLEEKYIKNEPNK